MNEGCGVHISSVDAVAKQNAGGGVVKFGQRTRFVFWPHGYVHCFFNSAHGGGDVGAVGEQEDEGKDIADVCWIAQGNFEYVGVAFGDDGGGGKTDA